MATLAVRPLHVRDLPSLGFVRRRCDIVDPRSMPSTLPVVQRQLLGAVPLDLPLDRVFAALIDDELCATVLMRPRPESFRWNVLALTAGSPRLAADDDVYEELWTALLEYGIRAAGESGAKRLFAATGDDGPAYRALRATAFEPYTRRFVVTSTHQAGAVEPPDGFRRQEPSDVWSIHQLYHHVTPRSVQAAEALTSSTWEQARQPVWKRLIGRRDQPSCYVIDTRDGIQAYLRAEVRGHDVVIDWLATPEHIGDIPSFIRAGVVETLGETPHTAYVSVPEYAVDVVGVLERSGFQVVGERIVLVRHTTVPAIVHPRLVPVNVLEAGERVPRGVPSYYRYGGIGIAAIQQFNEVEVDRMERRKH